MSTHNGLVAVATVADVQHRYGVRDPRVARRIMREAGAFTVARRLMIRLDDLAAWEGRQVVQDQGPPTPREGRVGRARIADPQPGWWRNPE